MNQPLLHNETELLLLLKSGDAAAFSQLFNHYRTTIYDVAYRFLKISSLAEEIVQDVFLKVWLKRNEMSEVRDFKAYVFIMARNIIFDRIKKMSYEITAQNELKNNVFYIDDTEYLVRHHECQQLLQQAIALLPPQQKQVYLLAKEEGLSHEKIAEQMALSKLTVKTHMAKALQSIRRYLNAQLNSFPLELLLAGTLAFL